MNPKKLESLKTKLKRSDMIRENYRRLRKITLHVIHGRLWEAAKLANHYNPLVRNPQYLHWRQRQNLRKVFDKFYPGLINQPSNKKYRVVLLVRDGERFPRSSAFIRLLSPLTSAPAASKVDLSTMSARALPPPDTDFVIVQRTAMDNIKQARKLAAAAEDNNWQIIVDTDDAFHHLDQNHPEFKTQSRRLEAVEYLTDEASQIWVSEERLIGGQYRSKSVIVRNTLDSRIWRVSPQKSLKANAPLRMVYMGTATHAADFKIVLPALDELATKYPQSFTLAVVGVADDLPNRAWIERLYPPHFGSLYPTFVSWFTGQGQFDVGLSPLVDSEFNRGKSDIKALDYLAAGILPVVSDALPYQHKEIEKFIIKVKDNEWAEKLESILNDRHKFRSDKSKIIASGQKYLLQKRSSDVAAKQLVTLLEKLSK